MIYAARPVEPRSKLMQYLIDQLTGDITEGYQNFVESEAWLDFISMTSRRTADLMCKLEEWQDTEKDLGTMLRHASKTAVGTSTQTVETRSIIDGRRVSFAVAARVDRQQRHTKTSSRQDRSLQYCS